MPDAVTVATIDPFHPNILAAIRAALPAGWTLAPAADQSPGAKAAAMRDADVVFVMAAPMPAALIAGAERLRFIQKLGAGTDRIDTAHCESRGIGVARLQAGNAIPVAEHTVMLILACCRRLVVLDRETRAGGWAKEEARGRNRHIHGRTVGIVGLGAIGRQVARVLSGFGVDLVYYDPFRPDAAVEAELGVRYLDLDPLLAESDVVTLHLPLTPETRGLIGAGRIAAMKPDAILVNCARGGLVDEAALAAALAEGRLLAAGLDAFESEPPAGSPLLGLDQTIVTPHLAGATLDNFASVATRAVENAKAYLAGRPLPPGDAVA